MRVTRLTDFDAAFLSPSYDARCNSKLTTCMRALAKSRSCTQAAAKTLAIGRTASAPRLAAAAWIAAWLHIVHTASAQFDLPISQLTRCPWGDFPSRIDTINSQCCGFKNAAGGVEPATSCQDDPRYASLSLLVVRCTF